MAVREPLSLMKIATAIQPFVDHARGCSVCVGPVATEPIYDYRDDLCSDGLALLMASARHLY